MAELDLDKTLTEAAEDVLSTMFFSMLDQAPEGASTFSTQVKIAFHGHATGALVLAASPEASAEMTANFLGLDAEPPPPEAEQEAVVKELANMICGAVLSRLEVTDVLHLLPPEILASPEAAAPGQSSCQIAEQLYSIGSGLLRLRFQLDGPA